MAKEPTVVSGSELVAALETILKIMKKEVERDPELGWEVTAGGLDAPSLAVVFTFDPETMRHKKTDIWSEKRAAKEWNKAHGIKN